MTYNPFTDLSCTAQKHVAKGIITSPGAGKTRSVRSVLNDTAKIAGDGTIVMFMPDLNLAKEQLTELRADLPHLNIEFYLVSVSLIQLLPITKCVDVIGLMTCLAVAFRLNRFVVVN